jgi:hypothetical protein
MSSTISQPIAACPAGVLTRLCASSPRSSTTVLATESAMPSTSPEASGQPKASPIPSPSAVATLLCASAPGIAMPATSRRSDTWKCSPTPNMSSTTPTSASWLASWRSPVKPGVWGPIATPASR